MKSHLSIIGLNFGTSRVLFRKYFPALLLCGVCLSFLLELSVFRFRSLIHLEVGFVQRNRYRFHFILLHLDFQFAQCHLLKMFSFLPCMFLVSLSNIEWMKKLCILMFGSLIFVSLDCMSVFVPKPYCLFF